jgi:hypothetical protein
MRWQQKTRRVIGRVAACLYYLRCCRLQSGQATRRTGSIDILATYNSITIYRTVVRLVAVGRPPLETHDLHRQHINYRQISVAARPALCITPQLRELVAHNLYRQPDLVSWY